jgi:UDPglucose--hexose-1-phosphate uridylyltransferase
MFERSLPHRRYNPLTGEWVLVSPQRAQRPWLGAVERQPAVERPAYDPACYLCPGNARAVGIQNPVYDSVYVFGNDFPALLDAPIPEPASELRRHCLLKGEQETGVCRVICFSPRHDLTLAQLPQEALRQVVDVWISECIELGARDEISYIQLFENKGEMMGCSNPHPHGQLWASQSVPTEVLKEQKMQRRWLDGNHPSSLSRVGFQIQPLLLDYVELELRDGERVIFQNDHFVCLVPWWAVWPFETLILPRFHVPHLTDLPPVARDALADAIQRITRIYDALFDTSFPYTMGIHQAPFDNQAHDEWQTHVHFYPPLLRSATVRKFMVGYEMLGQPQRDLTAEQAAARLRSLLPA